MIDDFVRLHPQISLTDERTTVTDVTFQNVTRISMDQSLVPPAFDVFVGSTQGEEHHRLFIDLHVEGILKRLRLNKHLRMDRLLLEIVVLHRISDMLLPIKDLYLLIRRAFGVMGCMIQDKLIELLLGIQPSQYPKIYQISRLGTIDQTYWDIHFIGAAAVARLMEVMSNVGRAIIRLPLLEEDMERGTDLFVEVPSANGSGIEVTLALSVKSTTRQPFTTFTNLQDDPTAQQLQTHHRLMNSLRILRERYGRPLIPVAVDTGRAANKLYEVSVQEEDVLAFLTLIRQNTRINTTQTRRVACA